MARKVAGAVVYLTQVFDNIIGAHIPMCVWLDSATLDLYRTRQ